MGLGYLCFLKSRSGPSKEYKTGLSFGGITINHHGLDQEGGLVSLSGGTRISTLLVCGGIKKLVQVDASKKG